MKKSGFLISSLTVAGIVANSTLASKSYYNDKSGARGLGQGFLERDQHFMLLGIVLIVPMGHMRHMDLTEVLQVVLRYHDLVTQLLTTLYLL